MVCLRAPAAAGPFLAASTAATALAAPLVIEHQASARRRHHVEEIAAPVPGRRRLNVGVLDAGRQVAVRAHDGLPRKFSVSHGSTFKPSEATASRAFSATMPPSFAMVPR